MANPLSSHTCAQLAGELSSSVLLWLRMREESSAAHAYAVVQPSGMPSGSAVAIDPADVVVDDAAPKPTSWMRQPAPHVCALSPVQGILHSVSGRSVTVNA